MVFTRLIKLYHSQRIDSLSNDLGKLNIYIQKNEAGLIPYTETKKGLENVSLLTIKNPLRKHREIFMI